MIVSVITVKLHASWVHSLKEKRMVVKSLCEKLKNKFNASVIESGSQDIHQTAEISVAFLSADNAQADSINEKISAFIENSTDAEVIDIAYETR